MNSEGKLRPRLRAAISARTERIVAEYIAGLREIDSPLVRPFIIDVIVEQARSILRGLTENRTAEAIELSRRIGHAKAAAGVRPADSIRAAGVLFEVALPTVHEVLVEHNALENFTEIVTDLNEAIYARVVAGAVPYMNVLLRQLDEAQTFERRRLARELHDRVSHSLAAGMQQLDLRAIDLSRGEIEAADDRLGKMRECLTEALAILRELASDLRHSPMKNDLVAALNEYVDTIAEQGIDLRLHVSGDLDSIVDEARDELYLVVREAINNAVAHSGSAEIVARVAMSEGLFEATVEDFGRGFDPHESDGRGSGVGLSSMRERMELLGGELKIASTVGLGTRVTALVLL